MYSGERSIKKIESAIRKPMITDKCNAKKLRVFYAQDLVEVNITT